MVPRPRKTRYGTWQADLRKFGQGEPTFKTRNEAEDAIFDAEQRHRKGLLDGRRPDPSATLADWLDDWLQLRQQQDETGKKRRSPTTLANEKSWTNSRLKPALGHIRLTELTTDDVNDWIDDMLAEPLRPATVSTYVGKLHCALDVAVGRRLIPMNPAHYADKPASDRAAVAVHTPDQIDALADAIGEAYGPLVYTLAYAGRIGEACGLRTDHLDLSPAGGLIHVREKVIEVSGKLLREEHLKTAAGLRSVNIPPALCRMLAIHLDRRPLNAGDVVFPTRSGTVTRPNNFRRRHWYHAVERAGVTSTRIHTLRHTAISRWIAEGANELEVTRWAGHSSVKVTHDIYGHLFDQKNPGVMARLDGHLQARNQSRHDADIIDFSSYRTTDETGPTRPRAGS